LKRKVKIAVRFHFASTRRPVSAYHFPRAGSLYLHTPVSFKPSMGWPQLVIHMFCVGLPITLVVRRYANGKSFRRRPTRLGDLCKKTRNSPIRAIGVIRGSPDP
jgi:hypothetical protein